MGNGLVKDIPVNDQRDGSSGTQALVFFHSCIGMDTGAHHILDHVKVHQGIHIDFKKTG